jgi:hypothetical protein
MMSPAGASWTLPGAGACSVLVPGWLPVAPELGSPLLPLVRYTTAAAVAAAISTTPRKTGQPRLRGLPKTMKIHF